MEPDEALELLQCFGAEESGLDQLARTGFHTLGLQTYLTAGPKESRAWTIGQGWTAPQAAGVIHTDFQRGFIKAEIVSLRRPRRGRVDGRRQGCRQGPHRGQGLRHVRRRRRGVPLQRVEPQAESDPAEAGSFLQASYERREHGVPASRRRLTETAPTATRKARLHERRPHIDPRGSHRCGGCRDARRRRRRRRRRGRRHPTNRVSGRRRPCLRGDQCVGANAVAVFDRYRDGSLRPAGSVATGGPGAGASLDSQGGLARDGRIVFVVNAGDDSVSALASTEHGSSCGTGSAPAVTSPSASPSGTAWATSSTRATTPSPGSATTDAGT